MTTSTKELIGWLDRQSKMAKEENCPNAAIGLETVAQRLRELDAQVTELELKLLTERGAKAWKDVPDATAFVEELRGNSDKPDCKWHKVGETFDTACNARYRDGAYSTWKTCPNCGGAVKSGGTPNE